jgi:DNA-binding IclR family transcriptional regulator
LSTLTAAELQKFIERANHWASRTAQGAVVDVPEITRATEFVRGHGYLCRYNLSIPGIGAISAPLPDRGEGERLVVTVAGAVDRIQQRGRKIIQALMQEVNLLERTYYRRMQREPILRQAAVGITATVMTSAVAACE